MKTRQRTARRITAALLLSLLSQTVALPAWCEDDPGTVQARARFKEGVDAFDKGKYEEARLAFLQAYTLKKHPSVLLNLAQSTAKANHPLEAAKYFSQFLREATTATPQQKDDAKKGLDDVRQKIGRIDVVAPPNTEITLDDQKVGTTPFPDTLDVEPGQHTVKSPTQSVTVTAVVGQKTEARLLPTEKPAPVPVKPEPTPTEPAKTEPPKTDTKKGGALSAPDPMWPVYAGLGVGGAGLVSAIVFAVFKSSAQSKADSVAGDIRTKAVSQYGVPAKGACNNPSIAVPFAKACATLRDNNDKVDQDALIANISLVVMGVGFLGAGIYYLVGPKKDEPTKTGGLHPKLTQLTPWAGYQSGGLVLSGDLF